MRCAVISAPTESEAEYHSRVLFEEIKIAANNERLAVVKWLLANENAYPVWCARQIGLGKHVPPVGD